VSDSASEKTHEATPQRREEALKEGRFAKSRDIGAVAASAAVLGILLGGAGALAASARELFARTHGDLGSLRQVGYSGGVHASVDFLAASAAPAALAAATISVGLGLAQSGGQISVKALTFDPTRLNPFPALQRMFSPSRAALELLMNVLRVGAVGYIVYRSLLLELPRLATSCYVPVLEGTTTVFGSLGRIATNATVALAVVAAVDYLKSRFTTSRDLRMSRQEVMDESKSRDGDGKMKGRMRARARALTRKRSLASVKTATVVVSNPTHISVALRYTSSDPAPVVVAKGHDEVALQIRAEARKYGIPILENRPLARALDAEVQIGHVVPSVHFAAVARVLAFVLRLGRGRGTRRA
jgi:flagellar biosynthesis protein FlhB